MRHLGRGIFSFFYSSFTDLLGQKYDQANNER